MLEFYQNYTFTKVDPTYYVPYLIATAIANMGTKDYLEPENYFYNKSQAIKDNKLDVSSNPISCGFSEDFNCEMYYVLDKDYSSDKLNQLVRLRKELESTSLLKKDGQGKIGIFKISDTQAVVNTNEGELYIDVNADGGGIFICNSSGENKISIKNRNLGENIISRKLLGSKTYTYNDIICSGDKIYCTIKRDTYLWPQMFRTYSGGTNKITVSFKNMSFKQTFHNLNGYGYVKYTKAIIGLYYTELGSLTPILACSPQEITLSRSDSESSGNNHVATKENIGFLRFTHEATKGGYEYHLRVNLIGEENKACLDDFMMDGTVDWSLDFVPNGEIIPRTIIGTDGFAIINDKDTYFMVKNTKKNGQQIFVNGLPNTSDGLEPGVLYNDNGTLKIVQ
jgi:hypothetical protein